MSKRPCAIVLPWGKCQHNAPPMGLCNSPDIFQETISTLMEGLEFVFTCINDALLTTKGDCDDHLKCVDLALQRMDEAGLKVNAEKSFFAMPHLEKRYDIESLKKEFNPCPRR